MIDNHDDQSAGRDDVLAATITVLSTDLDHAETKAQKRGWLDANGEVTPDGQSMVDALYGQMGTRSVFR